MPATETTVAACTGRVRTPGRAPCGRRGRASPARLAPGQREGRDSDEGPGSETVTGAGVCRGHGQGSDSERDDGESAAPAAAAEPSGWEGRGGNCSLRWNEPELTVRFSRQIQAAVALPGLAMA
jgi:hypothetical protein